MNNIGKRIQELRKMNQFTQEQLALAVGVSIPAVSKWENGASLPDVMLLSPIARFLKTDVNDLIQFKQNLTEHEVHTFAEQVKSLDFGTGIEKALLLVKEFPESNYLKLHLATLIINHDKGSIGDYNELCEKWLLHAYNYPNENDPSLVKPACLTTLIMLYKKTGQLNKAEVLLEIPEKPFDPTLLLSKVYLMQSKLGQAEEIFKREIRSHIGLLVANIEGLCDVHIELKEYQLAIEYASDYYEITRKVPMFHHIPSEPLLKVFLAVEDMKRSIECLECVVNEINESNKARYPSRYNNDSSEAKVRVWSTSGNYTSKSMFLSSLKENPNANVFLERDDVKDILKKLN